MTELASIGKSNPIKFDHNSQAHSVNPAEVYRELRAAAPVAWSESNGGYWVVSGHAELAEAAEHPELFSSALKNHDIGEPQGGIFIPAEKAIVPMIPTEMDPPLWREFRLLFAKQFSPAEVNRMKPMMTRLTTEYIDRVIERGTCDMVLDLASPIPADGVLVLLGLDLDEWAGYGEPYHNALGYPPGSAEFQHAVAGLEGIVGRIREVVQRCRKTGVGSDVMNAVLRAEIAGRPITDDEIVSVIYSIFSGGVDTTTSLLGSAFAHLSRHPSDRQFLIDDPSRIRLAIEEFMRISSPVQALGRTVVQDTVLGGQQLKAGDRVLLAWASANRDEKLFDNPDTCLMDRYPNRHVGFGVGIHRCAGAHFARAQIEIILQQVLERMPDYRIDEQQTFQYPNIGVVNGWVQMPATFSPGQRRGGD